jgi:hypothetical protein
MSSALNKRDFLDSGDLGLKDLFLISHNPRLSLVA